MKQLLVSYRTGELTLAEVPVPAVEPGGLLVRTSTSLISAGTEKMALDLGKRSLLGKAQDRPDLVQKVVEKVQRDGLLATARTVFAKLDEPVPLGYSCAGRVLEVGAGVVGFRRGDRVACAGAKLANHAEVNAVPQLLTTPIPDAVSDEAAAFVTVGTIALQGVRTANVGLGESVAVIGLGLIGQLTVRILRAAGCRVLGIDLDPHKLELALAGGAAHAVLRSGAVDSAAAQLSGGRGVDAVLICAAAESNDPIELAGQLARDRGRVVVVGAVPMDVPRRPFYDKELGLRLSRSYGPGRYDPEYEERGHDYPIGYVRWTEGRNFAAFLALCADGRVDVQPLISHRFAIAEAPTAYALLAGQNRAPYLGVLLTYPEEGALSPTVALAPALALDPASAVDGRAAAREIGAGREVRLGFVGAGAFASGVLAPAFAAAPGVRLKTIVSARGVSARHLGLKLGFAQASTDVDALWQDPTVDAVVIATRHHLHAAQTCAALAAGKHVFVEKPLALTAEELAAVAEAARRSARILMVGYNRRFAPLVQQLSAFFAERRQPLVMVYRINAGPLPRDSWIVDPLLGGGRVIGEVCHFVDLLSALAGGPPVRVTAASAGAATGAATDRGGQGPEDQLVANLSFADGSLATLAYSGDGDPSYPKERLEVLGDGKLAVLEDFRTLELSGQGRRRYGRSLTQDKGHRAEARAFAAAVRSGGPPPIPLASLLATSAATLAIVAALHTGDPQRLPAVGGA